MKPIRSCKICSETIIVLLFAAFYGAAALNSSIAAEPPPGTPIVHPVDRALMVYVPSGEFIMGVSEEEGRRIAADLGQRFESLWIHEAFPRHSLFLPGFFIDRYEVTVEQWQNFLEASGGHTGPAETVRWFGVPHARLFPAGGISWNEAKRYAKWAGKALPTEAQWEKAARGTDGRFYPWGHEPPTPQHGHFGTGRYKGSDGVAAALYTWIGRYALGASPYGAFDMLGNQYEWTSDRMLPYPGNPEGEKMKAYAEQMVVLRGGSWYHGWVSFYAAKRFGLKPDETYYHVGFRTVWIPPDGYFESEQFARDRHAVAEREDEIRRMQKDAEAAGVERK